jgi:hypothetical protein
MISLYLKNSKTNLPKEGADCIMPSPFVGVPWLVAMKTENAFPAKKDKRPHFTGPN